MSGTAHSILLVDDYPDALDVWRLYLEMCGFEVATAADGLTAVRLATEKLPDIIILDLELPGISGVEAARRIRTAPATSGIPLIAATGHSHPVTLGEARHAGFDVIVTKPCDPDYLLGEIRRLLGGRPIAEAVPVPTLNR
jgi:CheY-like chemotaxis protein